MKMQKKTMLIVLAVILALGAAVLVYYLVKVNNYQAKVENMTFTEIDIGDIPDGTYRGASDVDLIAVQVEVSVQDGRMVAIDLLQHKNGSGKAAEETINEMISRQTTDVDAVSGATNSSKVIRKAVENALLGNE